MSYENLKSGKKLVQIGELFNNMPVTRQHWKAGLALFFAYVIEAWEMMILILSISSIKAEFKMNEVQVGSLLGAIFLGMIPGNLVWGKIIDSIGRKKSMIYSFVLYGIFSGLSAASVSYDMLWLMRFAAGVSISGVVVAAFPYFEELLPVKVRGKATVYLASGWPVGYLLAIGVTYCFLNTGGWRWSIGISSLAGLWALVLWKLVPESPYWLAGKGRNAEAKEVIKQLSGKDMHAELDNIELVVEKVKSGSYIEIFKGKFLRITILQMIINVSFAWGYWGLTSWMPILLDKKGLSSPQGWGFMAISALFMFPGYIASSYLTGKYGRKKVMFWFVLLAAVGGFGFGLSNSITELYIGNFVLSFFSLGAWGVWDTWMGELYPTKIRGVSYSLGCSLQKVSNVIAPIVIGTMLASNYSFIAIVSSIMVFMVITFILILFLNETEGEILQ